MNEVRIRLRPQQHPEVWATVNHRRSHFFTRFDHLIEWLQQSQDQSAVEKPAWHSIPLLPSYIRWYANQGSESWALLEQPAGTLAVGLETRGVEFFTVALPRILFAVHRRENRVLGGSIRCTLADGPLTPHMMLGHYPLSNVYDDGHLCWSPPNQEWPLDQLDALFRGYLATPHNFHLATATHNGGGLELRELLEKLSMQSVFPSEWLVPTESLSQWLERLAPPPQ